MCKFQAATCIAPNKKNVTYNGDDEPCSIGDEFHQLHAIFDQRQKGMFEPPTALKCIADSLQYLPEGNLKIT